MRAVTASADMAGLPRSALDVLALLHSCATRYTETTGIAIAPNTATSEVLELLLMLSIP